MSKSTYIFFFYCLSYCMLACHATPAAGILYNGSTEILPGSYDIQSYLPLLKDKKVGLVVNHTSMVGDSHLVDTLLSLGVDVKVIFAPEHGFKGKADAGEHIQNGLYLSRIPIKSLYGKNKKPSVGDIELCDVVLFDIQDVGVRFYTFLSTLHYAMEAAAEGKKKMIVLDRPNPNIARIDGPVMEKENMSFVGLHPVPILYGMTIGEYAKMINGQKWLANHIQADLTVIPIKNYNRLSRYELPIAPSPNLPNQRSILLYPSLCLFEGTEVSVGRGTDKQFQIYGNPFMARTEFTFIPVSSDGAKYPPHENIKCGGQDLSMLPVEDLYSEQNLNLDYIFDAFQKLEKVDKPFFLSSNFFEKLAGTNKLRDQLIAGATEQEIRESWGAGLAEFKKIRSQYLIYP